MFQTSHKKIETQIFFCNSFTQVGKLAYPNQGRVFPGLRFGKFQLQWESSHPRWKISAKNNGFRTKVLSITMTCFEFCKVLKLFQASFQPESDKNDMARSKTFGMLETETQKTLLVAVTESILVWWWFARIYYHMALETWSHRNFRHEDYIFCEWFTILYYLHFYFCCPITCFLPF